MKNINFKLLLLVLLILQSCDSDRFLDTPPPTLSDAAFFSNDEAAISVLAGAYDPMGWYNSYQLTEWAIGDVTSDDAEKGGGGDGDYAEIYSISTFASNSENPLIAQRWTDFYIGINRSNKLIEGITDNPNITIETQERLIAEAKFLRGFYLFQLVRTFGAVPVVDHILSPSEYQNPRNTLEECWTQIENDFKDAAAVLPAKSALSPSELGRATWGASMAFLTKAYIEQGKWILAESSATEIVKSYEYDLEPDYADLFIIDTDNGVESIFDIQFADLQSPAWADGHEGSHLEVIQRSRDTRNGGWGFDQPTQDLYDEYEAGDIRRDLTIISDGDVLWAGTPDEEVIYTAKNPLTNPDSYTGYNKRKGTLPASQRGNGEDQAGLNVRVIRFAEVLLWQAEAAAHNQSDWQTPLNRVRSRVEMLPVTGGNALNAVYHERRVELAMESHRYWDLVRTGRGTSISGYSENKRYFLIPQVQISLNPNLDQNPY